LRQVLNTAKLAADNTINIAKEAHIVTEELDDISKTQ